MVFLEGLNTFSMYDNLCRLRQRVKRSSMYGP